MRVQLLLSTVGLATAVAALSLGCGDSAVSNAKGTMVTQSAQIEVTPTDIVFPAAIQGSVRVEQVTITNTGDGDLLVDGITMRERDSAKEFSLEFEPPESYDARIDESQICPGTSGFKVDRGGGYCVFWVVYRPQDANPDSGEVVISSNDTRRHEFTVSVSSGESAPYLTIDPPPPVKFGDVVQGERGEVRLSLFNTGNFDLVIQDVVLVNDADGQFTLEAQLPEGVEALPVTLAPSDGPENREQVVLVLGYEPNRSTGAQGKLRIESNDPEHRIMDVLLEGGSMVPCIEVTPEAADFGDVLIGDAAEVALDVTNCGTTDLVVSRLSLTGDSSPDLAITSAPEGLDCADGVCAGEVHLSPETTDTIVVTYTPSDEGADGGKLVIENDVPGKEHLEVPLFGRGSNNICPVAVAEVRVQGSDVWDTFPDEARRLETIPLKTLEFRGDRSSDPDGAVAGYQWSILSRPEGSTAQFEPSDTAANPTFFLDLAGEYVFELQVTDDRGMPSCEPALTVVQVTPDEAIHVQLVWHTPRDQDETDRNGSDLDLHFLHPMGFWFDLPFDCYFRNGNPDWGRMGNGRDDPSLDIDDVDGAGPENINLDDPEDGYVYRVGIHYYDDHDFGPALATVRIYINGRLRYEHADRRMPDTNYFWEVANISWPSGDIMEVDNMVPPEGGIVPPELLWRF